MRYCDADETISLLPYTALADEIALVLRLRGTGLVQAPSRLHLPLPGGMLLVMPAADPDIAVVKLVTVHPDNAAKSMPTINGEVVVMDAATGQRLGILDGRTVTARRTAAVSLLAARLLAPRPDGPLLVLGAGAQAAAHVAAFREGLGTKEAIIVSRTPDKALRLAELAHDLGLRATVAERPDEVLERATVIVTATTSRTPVLPEGIRSDAFVAAVGAYTPDAAEIPAGLMRAARVYLDTLDGLEEAGDIVQAGLGRDKVTPLEDVLDAPPRPDGRPVVFKSVGHAAFDLAAARLAFCQPPLTRKTA